MARAVPTLESGTESKCFLQMHEVIHTHGVPWFLLFSHMETSSFMANLRYLFALFIKKAKRKRSKTSTVFMVVSTATVEN